MSEQQEQERADEPMEDLEVPEEAAEDVGGGRDPSAPDPVPIPYPNR